jgi:hypothetical protein
LIRKLFGQVREPLCGIGMTKPFRCRSANAQ